MGISAEWADAKATVIDLATRGQHPFASDEPVESTALVFDPHSGGGFVVEGSPRELSTMLNTAKKALAPALAAEALQDWNRYRTTHAALAAADTYAADLHEDDELPKVAAALAEALAALFD